MALTLTARFVASVRNSKIWLTASLIAGAALLLFGLSSCSAGEGAPRVLLEATSNPLRAQLRVEGTGITSVEYSVSGPGSGASALWVVSDLDEPIMILGMRPDSPYSVEVIVHRSNQPAIEQDIQYRTGALPVWFPTFEVAHKASEIAEGGLTLFNVDNFGASGDDEPGMPVGLLVIVDDAGYVVWYETSDRVFGDARLVPPDRLLVESDAVAGRLISLSGETLGSWHGRIADAPALSASRPQPDASVAVDTDSMHHEHAILPNGNHLTLSTELLTADVTAGGCPSGAATPPVLISDVVVEFDPASGHIARAVRLADFFDPSDPAWVDSLCGPPNPPGLPHWYYQIETPSAVDWTHANSASYDAASETVLVSVRHLDTVLALDWSAEGGGSLAWSIGPSGTLAIDGMAPSHMHAPVLDGNRLLLYDNGNRRSEGQLQTRVVEYELDLEGRTATQRWEYWAELDGEPLFMPFVGDIDLLPGGNVLITDGAINGTRGNLVGQISEIRPGPQAVGGEIAWSLRVGAGPGWVVYRSERLPELYQAGFVSAG